MTLTPTLQYLGFRNVGGSRRFLLKASQGGMSRQYAVEIPQDAFLHGRVKLQDGPDICYAKARKDLEATALSEAEPAEPVELAVTDDDLAEYQTSHSPKPSRRFSPDAAAPAAPAQAPAPAAPAPAHESEER